MRMVGGACASDFFGRGRVAVLLWYSGMGSTDGTSDILLMDSVAVLVRFFGTGATTTVGGVASAAGVAADVVVGVAGSVGAGASCSCGGCDGGSAGRGSDKALC